MLINAVVDIEAMEWPFADKLGRLYLLGDVLEHLCDPWNVLSSLSEFLISGGQVVVSLPDVRFYGVSIPLLFRGRSTSPKRVWVDRTICDFLLEALLFQFLRRRVCNSKGIRHYGP